LKDSILYPFRYFFLVFVPVWIAGLVMILTYSKRQLFLGMNSVHSSFFDQFFKWETWLGNGIIFIIVVAILFIKNKGWGILGLIVFTIGAVLPQFFKKWIFSNSIRPVKYFENIQQLHLVEGVKQHLNFSFPSGHSTSIVALGLLLCFVVKNKNWGYLIAVTALVTMYSRVYLAQHFLIDVLAGAILGMVAAFAGIAIYKKWIEPSESLNKGLLRSRSKPI
jgi:membrane-associated phospholipid phosphatase